MHAALLLGFCDGVERKGCLTRRFRSINFDDTATRETSDAESHIQLDAARRDHRNVLFRLAAQRHDGTLTEVLFDLGDGGFDGLGLFARKRGIEGCSCRFLCHVFIPFYFNRLLISSYTSFTDGIFIHLLAVNK